MDKAIYNMLIDLRHYQKFNRRSIIIASLSNSYSGVELRRKVRIYEECIKKGLPGVVEVAI